MISELGHALEIGGGDHRLEGAVQVDCVAGPGVDVVACWGREALPFADATFDLVYASHCLEHIPWDRTHHALREVSRVLKPGGALEVWVPDLAYLLDKYHRGIVPDDHWLDMDYGDVVYWLNARLFNYGHTPALDDPQRHHACFDFPYLRRCLLRSGFGMTERMTKTRTRDHYKIQLGVRAVK